MTDIRKRVSLLFLVIMTLSTFLILRLFWIQLIQGDKFKEQATLQRENVELIEPKRGTIYDRNMNELVASISVNSIYAIPSYVESKENTAKQLAKILNLEEETLLNKLKSNNSFEWVKRKVDWDIVQIVRGLDLQGVKFVEESKRYYNQQLLASHVLGFTGLDNQGLTGIEKEYDAMLRGEPGQIILEHDAAGRLLPQGVQEYVQPKPGNKLVLTIDQTIQYYVERELEKIVEQYNPSNATIIVMAPKTGEILAMGNRPSYNPNSWQDYKSSVWGQNDAIWYNYEPGSTFKIITGAAALEEAIVKEDDHFYDPGYAKIMSAIIRCWNIDGHGDQTLLEVFQNSCNTAFVEIGQELGKDNFYKYINAFGFGQRTGIDLPGEAAGIILDKETATKLDLATMSIGQSIAVTPIQLITAISAAINGGHLMEPHLVKEIRDDQNNVIKEVKQKEIRQVISETTSIRLRNILETVVSKGTGKSAYVEGYSAGGKTGTAQVVGDDGRYESGKYVASFTGFAPVDDPQIAVLIMIGEPKGGNYYGGQIAAPVFSSIASDTLIYMKVPRRNN